MENALTKEVAAKNLARNLKRVMRENKWNQADLARAIQVKGESPYAAAMRISRCLAGRVPQSVELHNMETALGIDDLLFYLPS